MGLFFENPAEKRLKDLTGGNRLKKEFLNTLKRNGLDASDGREIQRVMRRIIRERNINPNAVEKYLNILIDLRIREKNGNFIWDEKITLKITEDSINGVIEPDLGHISYVSTANTTKNDAERIKRNREAEKNRKNPTGRIPYKPPLKISKKIEREAQLKREQEEAKQIKIEAEEREKELELIEIRKNRPKESQNDAERIRRNREAEKIKLNPSKNNTSNISSKDELKFEEKNTNKESKKEETENDEIKRLKRLYNQKISKGYNLNFKYAYVIYLNTIYNNPTKKFKEDYGKEYGTNLEQLIQQAKKDNYTKEGTIATTLKGCKVKDLKAILKKFDLIISGSKDDLIERITTNIPEEEIKIDFPDESIEVTESGLNFIKKHPHIIIYDKDNNIRNILNPETFDLIIENEEYTKNYDEQILYKLLIKNSIETEKEGIKNNDYTGYRILLSSIASFYLKIGNKDKQLEYYLKTFLTYINNPYNFNNNTRSYKSILNPHLIDKINKLLEELNLEFNTLNEKFKEIYENILIKKYVNYDDSFICLLRAFNNEDIEIIANDLIEKIQ